MSKETTQKELVQYQDKATELEKFALSIEIKSDDDLTRASDQVKQAKEAQKTIEKKKDEYVLPAKQILERAKADFDPLIKAFKGVETILKDKATIYITEKNRKIKEEEDKITKKVEEGKMKEGTALKKMEKLPEQTKTVQGNASQLRVTEYEDIEIVDVNLIPREYMLPDTTRIKAVVLKARVEVAGVKIIKKTKTASY